MASYDFYPTFEYQSSSKIYHAFLQYYQLINSPFQKYLILFIFVLMICIHGTEAMNVHVVRAGLYLWSIIRFILTNFERNVSNN